MTIQKFWELVNLGQVKGKLVKTEHDCSSSSGHDIQLEVFELAGYKIIYQNHRFLCMKEIATNKTIMERDCTRFEVENLDNNELEQLIEDAQKVLKQRTQEEAQKALDNFTKAWKELKHFSDVGLQVMLDDKSHYDTTVGRVDLGIFPLA